METSKFWVFGSKTRVEIDSDWEQGNFGTLNVTGKVNWNAGTFDFGIDITSSNQCDRWTSDGDFTIGVGTRYDLEFAGELYYGNWDIIKSVSGKIVDNSSNITGLPVPFDVQVNPADSKVWQLVYPEL